MESQACPHLLWNVESPPFFFSRITFISGIAFLLCKCKDLSSNPGNSQKLSPRPCMPAMAHMHTMHTRTSNKLKTNKCKIKIKKKREKSPLERNSREGKQASVWVINLGWLCLFWSSVPWTFGDCFYLSLGWVGQAGFPSKMARPKWIKQEQGQKRILFDVRWWGLASLPNPWRKCRKDWTFLHNGIWVTSTWGFHVGGSVIASTLLWVACCSWVVVRWDRSHVGHLHTHLSSLLWASNCPRKMKLPDGNKLMPQL